MSESEGYSVQEGIRGQKRKRKNSDDEKDAAELKRESSSGSDESATGEDREDKETGFSIPLAAKKRKEEETSLAKLTQTNHNAAMRALRQQDSSSYYSGDFELKAKEEGEGMGGGERDDIESSQEVSEAEWVIVDQSAEDDKSLKLSANTRQDSLAELTFAFQKPAGHTLPPMKFFQMPQGHEMIVFVEYGQDDCTIKVEARGEKKQERNLCWPLKAKIMVLLHPQKDTQRQLMEGERCEGPGKQLCSLKVRKDNIMIKSMGFVDKCGMMNITLITAYA